MGCGGAIESTVAELGGAAIGGAIGGPIGAGIGAAGGSALTGGSLKQDLLAGATAGIGSSVDVGQALGLDTSISGTVQNALGDAAGGIGSSLGLTDGTSGAPGDLTPGGAPANPTTGQAMSAPASTTASSPGSGGGGTVSPGGVADFDTKAIESQFSSGLNTGTSLGGGISATSPSFSTLSGAAADSALGSAGTDAIGSVPAGVQAGAPVLAGPVEGGVPGSISSASPGAIGPAGTGGLKDWLPSKSEVGSTLLKGALPAASLAYSAIKGPAELPADARNLESGGAATAPLLALENQGANEGLTGQLTPSQQASVTQMVQNAQNQLIQQLAQQGVTNPTQDSRYIAGMQQIQQQAMAQQQAYIQQAIQNATSAGGAASGNIASVANEQVQLDTDYQNALAAAFGALGGSVGGGVNINPART